MINRQWLDDKVQSVVRLGRSTYKLKKMTANTNSWRRRSREWSAAAEQWINYVV